MEAETFIQHPLILDPSSKAISAPSASAALAGELAQLNALHRGLISLDPPNVPPPPLPVNPKRSAQIAKLRDTANTSHRKGSYGDAVKLYTYAIDMAISRPSWEPISLIREELSGLYSNRAQAHMADQAWPEALVDARSSVECKAVGNAKAWWRGGRCLVEMGRWEEAHEWVSKALDIEGKELESGKELTALMVDIERGMDGKKL